MKNVVIIGGGPAGITAAYELLARSTEYRVTILEETEELGGISRTVRHKGNRMDIGGHRFFSKDDRVTEWWAAMMPIQGKYAFDDIKLGREKHLSVGGPDPETEDRVMLIRNRVSRIYYQNNFFDYPISMKMQTFRNLGWLKTAEAGFSYFKAKALPLEENSLENFYINRFGRVLYGMFFEGYTEKLWGRHPREISAEWGAQRVKGLSISAIVRNMLRKLVPKSSADRRIEETSLIEEFHYPKFGPGQLWETAAGEVLRMGGAIHKNCRVVGINTNAHKAVEEVVYESAGDTIIIDADVVISSMPLKDLVKGMSEVQGDIAEIAAGLPYRDFITVGLLVKRLNLKNETTIKTLGNIVPDCWIYVQDTDIKLGRIQIFNNWSPYLVQKPEETVWIGLEYFCSESDSFWNLQDQECISFAVGELVKMGVINGEEEVLDSHREKVKKAYPAYFDTYRDLDRLQDYLDQYENLYCVGRNGQHRYNNMDHSMATSFEAVKNIMDGVRSKKNIWNVNTEKDYHETKNKGN